jgi:hypothetical protein
VLNTIREPCGQKKTANGTHLEKDAYRLAALPLADSLLNLPRANGNTPLA